MKQFSDIQQLLSAATDSKRYFEFLLHIYWIYISLKGFWNDATIAFLYESLFSEKILTQLNYFFEKCRVWQLCVTDGTKLVHINQKLKKKIPNILLFFSLWNLEYLSATNFFLCLNDIFLWKLANLLPPIRKVYKFCVCSNQILFLLTFTCWWGHHFWNELKDLIRQIVFNPKLLHAIWTMDIFF